MSTIFPIRLISIFMPRSATGVGLAGQQQTGHYQRLALAA
jgi:hypothetical protein